MSIQLFVFNQFCVRNDNSLAQNYTTKPQKLGDFSKEANFLFLATNVQGKISYVYYVKTGKISSPISILADDCIFENQIQELNQYYSGGACPISKKISVNNDILLNEIFNSRKLG